MATLFPVFEKMSRPCKRTCLDFPESQLPTSSVLDAMHMEVLSEDQEVCLLGLKQLREFISKSGQSVQRVVFDSNIFSHIIHLFMVKDCTPVVSSAARVICSVVVKNKELKKAVLDIPGLLDRLMALLQCPDSDLSATATWVLSAFVEDFREIGDRLLAQEHLFDFWKSAISGSFDDAQASAAWIFCVFARESREVQLKLVDGYNLLHCLAPLLEKPGITMNTRGLFAWAIRELTVDNAPAKRIAVDLGVLPALGAMLADTVPHATRSSAVWAIGTICSDNDAFQNLLRDMGLVQVVVNLIDTRNTPLFSQTCNTVMQIASKNAGNQCLVVQLGIFDKLFSAIEAMELASVSAVMDKVLSLMLTLLVKNIGNQNIFIEHRSAIKFACEQLTSTRTVRCRGLAAGILRVVCTDRLMAQRHAAAYGAIGHLMSMLSMEASSLSFSVEQSVAALAVLCTSSEMMDLAVSLDIETAVVDIISSCSAKVPPPFVPSKLAVTCALVLLQNLCADKPATCASLVVRKTFMEALFLHADVGSACLRIRSHANALLRTLLPADVYAVRKKRVQDFLIQCIGHAKFVDDQMPSRCPICLSCDADATHPVSYMPCMHAFHVSCIQGWLDTGHDECPVCKTAVLKNLYSSVVHEK